MTTPELPIGITQEQRSNRYVSPRIAAEAFRAAGYDLTPEKPDITQHAIDLGLLRMVEVGETANRPGTE